MEMGSAVLLETALRVLTTYCDLGNTATAEDERNVRWWAGDAGLPAPDAAAVVIQRELERGLTPRSSTSAQTVPPVEAALNNNV
jgi:hypothetical protein